MVRNDTVMHFSRTIGRTIGEIGARLNQGAHQISVIIVVFALQKRTNAFKPHPCVDGLLFQIDHTAVFEFFVLHENEVPDFNESVPIFFRTARRSPPDMIAMIVKNFGTRPTRSRRAHHPKIIICGDPDDFIITETGHFFPNLCGLIIGVINSDKKAVFVQAKFFGQQFPSKGNCVRFEIITKAEIAEHFKKRMMARCVAHIVEVIVLSAGTHTFLRGRRALIIAGFYPCEQVFELHHTRVDKHQGRIIARDQGACRDDLMIILAKVTQKCGSDVV